jgi:hypothetical protein
MHCFGKFANRAHISHALRLSASATMIAFRSGCWLRTLCFGSSRRKVHGARSSIPASVLRQGRQGSICIGVHRRLTIRSSRPHVVASAVCFTLRLHTSAAPPRVGLTQALGGKKHSVAALPVLQLIVFGQHCSSDGSWARFFFGQVRYARSHFARVALAGFGRGNLHLLVLSV